MSLVVNMSCAAKCSLISELSPHCTGADNSVSSTSTTATSQNYEVTTGYYINVFLIVVINIGKWAYSPHTHHRISLCVCIRVSFLHLINIVCMYKYLWVAATFL